MPGSTIVAGGRAWTRRVLALLAVVWLNLALQPCAMAFADDADCPHCPPEMQNADTAHHGHAGHADESPCASLYADCADAEDLGFDTRSSQGKAKADAACALLPAPQTLAPVVASRVQKFPTGPPFRPHGAPPIHLLNCVFLK